MRSMSRRRVLLAAALLGSGLTGALAQDKTPVKLGAIEILTGRTAATGSRSSAASTSRSPTSTRPAGVLGGRPLALAYEDSAGAKEQALNAARKLIGATRSR